MRRVPERAAHDNRAVLAPGLVRVAALRVDPSFPLIEAHQRRFGSIRRQPCSAAKVAAYASAAANVGKLLSAGTSSGHGRTETTGSAPTRSTRTVGVGIATCGIR